MRHWLTGLAFLVAAATPALAGGGGMGDPSEHTRQMNAICEMQKHGHGPLYPNMCLPEYPPGPVETRGRR